MATIQRIMAPMARMARMAAPMVRARMAVPMARVAQFAQTTGVKRTLSLLGTASTVAGVVSSVDSGVKEYAKYKNGQVSKVELLDKLALIFLSNIPCPFIKLFASLATQHKLWEKNDFDAASLVTAVSAHMPIDPIGMHDASMNLFAAANWFIDSNKLFDEAKDKKLTSTELWSRQVSLNDKLLGVVGVG